MLSNEVAVQVLGNASLFVHIASFQDGPPHILQHSFRSKLTSTPGVISVHSIVASGDARQFKVATRERDRLGLNVACAMRDAIQWGRVEMLRWMLEHGLPWLDVHPWPPWAVAVAYFEGDTAILDLLKAHFTIESARCLNEPYMQGMFAPAINSVKMLRWFDANGMVLAVTPLVLENAARRGDMALVAYLLHDRGVTCSAKAYTCAWRNGCYDVLHALLAYAPHGWDSSLVKAVAINGDLDYLLHLHQLRPLGEVDVGALDGAASGGHLEVVQFLHEQTQARCTTRAMDGAAANGHFEVVRYLHLHRTEGCTTRAMDSAAASGHLELVQFLHENRVEGASTAAMDSAAASSLSMVRFLHEHRREGCTTEAMNRAAHAGKIDIVRFLLANRSEGCTSTVLASLLVAGEFDLWKSLCATQKHVTSDGTELAMKRAAATFKMSTIRFIVEELGREDLIPHAMDAAMAATAPVSWLHVLHEYSQEWSVESALNALLSAHVVDWDPSGSPRYCDPSDVRLFHFILAHCNTSTEAYEEAKQSIWLCFGRYGVLRDINNKNSIDYLPLINAMKVPLLHVPGVPDWFFRVHSKPPRMTCAIYRRPLTWIIHAIIHNDLDFIQVLHRYSLEAASSADAGQDLVVPQIEQQVYQLNFAGARAAAVYWDRLPILKWLLENVDTSVEPTLLDEAIFYNKPHIAEWLVDNHPAGCQEFGVPKPYPTRSSRAGLSDETMAWLLSNEKLVAGIDFGGIACYAAEQGNLEWLQTLIARYQSTVIARSDIVDRAAAYGHVLVMEYLIGIGCSYNSMAAIAQAAAAGHLPVVRFLLKQDPTLCSCQALANATHHYRVRVVRFLWTKPCEEHEDALVESKAVEAETSVGGKKNVVCGWRRRMEMRPWKRCPHSATTKCEIVTWIFCCC